MAGFLLSGFLFTFLGSLLPAWGYDVSGDFAAAGRHFLAFALGALASWTIVRRFGHRSTRMLLVAGCALALGGLTALALLPNLTMYRLAAVAVTGMAAGLFHTGLFEAILPAYRHSAAVTLTVAGISFGSGSVLCTLLVSGTFWAASVQTILLILAAIPAGFLVLYLRTPYPAVGMIPHPDVLKQFRSAAAVLFSLLLFFQFGNEWSIAEWLPLFLIHRVGMSPVAALQFLTVYFTAITVGRVIVSRLIPLVNHWRLLAASAAASLFGCIILAETNNRFGVIVSIVLLGFGFAPIYPVVAAWIGRKFPYYHPGFFNGIFSIALAGGMLAPWLLGEIASRAGINAIMILPAIGTCMVLLLLCLIWIEGRVTA